MKNEKLNLFKQNAQKAHELFEAQRTQEPQAAQRHSAAQHTATSNTLKGENHTSSANKTAQDSVSSIAVEVTKQTAVRGSRRSMRMRSVAAVVTLGLALSACGSSQNTTNSAASETAKAAQAASASSTNGQDEQDSPLISLLGFSEGNENERQVKVEEAIARCMRSAGFDYKPAVANNNVNNSNQLSSKEYREKYGYGITTQRFSQSAVGSDLLGYEEPSLAANDSANPNDATLNAMSESEREAWQAALFGTDDFDAFEPGEDSDQTDQSANGTDALPEPSGCYEKAVLEADDSIEKAEVIFQQFGGQIDELFQRIDADAKVLEAQRSFERCMGEKGFSFKNEDEISEHLEAKMASISNQGPETELSDADRAVLAKAQAEEFKIAQTADECGFENLQKVRLETSKRLEQEFIDNNKDALAKLGN